MKRLTFLFLLFSLQAMGQKNPCNPTGAPYTSLPGDTTIVLPHGTQLTFNRCEFFDKRDCLEFTEAYDIESMRRQNLTTLDRDGNVLLTAGMFCMKLTGDCAAKPCFEVPVKARMPLPSVFNDSCGTCQKGTFRLYDTRDGVWGDSASKNFRLIDSGGRKWIEFTIYCGNICYNGDCPLPVGGKTKIKVKNVHKLEKVEIVSECPLGMLRFFPKKGRKKVVARLPCYGMRPVMVVAYGYDKNGGMVSSPETSSTELKHSRGKRKCVKFGKMGKGSKKGGLYKRYVINM